MLTRARVSCTAAHDPNKAFLLACPTIGIAAAVGSGQVAYIPSAIVPHMNVHAKGYREKRGAPDQRGSIISWMPGNMIMSVEGGGTQTGRKERDKLRSKKGWEMFKNDALLKSVS